MAPSTPFAADFGIETGFRIMGWHGNSKVAARQVGTNRGFAGEAMRWIGVGLGVVLLGGCGKSSGSGEPTTGCTPNAARCQGFQISYCPADGSDWGPAQDCALGEVCRNDICQRPTTTCTAGERRCGSGGQPEVCRAGAFAADTPCGVSQICVDPGATCIERTCSPGVTSCTPDGRGTHTCNAQGSGYENATSCGEGNTCENGVCKAGVQCTPGTVACGGRAGEQIMVCADSGTAYEPPRECPTNQVCRCEGANCQCRVVPCDEGTRKCYDLKRYRQCVGGRMGELQSCAGATVCRSADGSCGEGLCDPSVTKVCGEDGRSIRTCSPDGQDFLAPVACPAGTPGCIEPTAGNAICSSKICEQGQTRCTEDRRVENCKADGTGYLPALSCPNGFCDPTVNACVQYRCDPGERACFDAGSVRQCKADGTGWEPPEIFEQLCDLQGEGETCVNGQCLSACAIAVATNSYQGCEYYAADVPNGVDGNNPIGTAQNPQFAVVIANSSGQFPARVTITQGVGDTPVTARVCPPGAPNPQSCPNVQVTDAEIPAGDLRIFNLPSIQWNGGSGVRDNEAFRIRANRPVAAYQFNPLDNAGGTYSNDASLLLPVHTLQDDYWIMHRASGSGANPAPSQFTLVGVAERPISVTITLPASNANIAGGGGVTQQNAGATFQVPLRRGQIVNFDTRGATQDLTGTHVRCTNPGGEDCGVFAVFAGHACANIEPNQSYCDHIEEMMFPALTWGTEYVVAPTKVRGDPAFNKNFDLIRVLARVDGTTLEYAPAAPSGAPTTLNAGQWAEFGLRGPGQGGGNGLVIRASQPVLVGQFMKGATTQSTQCDSCNANNPLCNTTYYRQNCWGDPAFILAVPTQQYRRDYVFLTPGAYKENWVTVIAPNGSAVRLNGQVILPGEWKPIAEGFSAATINLGPAYRKHTLLVDTTGAYAGISVYGWDQDVSYGYPGGLDLKIIQSR